MIEEYAKADEHKDLVGKRARIREVEDYCEFLWGVKGVIGVEHGMLFLKFDEPVTRGEGDTWPPSEGNYLRMGAFDLLNTCWVCMTDKFLSGWGQAVGRKNKLVIECETYAEAYIVEANAKRRPEMRYVSIRLTKPYYNKKKIVTSYHDKTDYNRWFLPDQFKGEE